MASLRYLVALLLVTVQFSSVLSQQCPQTYTVKSSDTCISLMATYFQNVWKMFPLYNNGTTCSSLLLQGGLQICIPALPPPPIANDNGTTCAAYYQVQFGDSYFSILYNYFGSNATLYSIYNGGSTTVQVGQWICLAVSPNSLYTTMAPSSLIPGTNLGFSVGLNLSSSANSTNDKKNKFSRFVSVGFVNQTGSSTWNYPLSKDWRAEGKLKPVTNQGNCPSCWAYAATAAIESAYSIVNNASIGISEQQIVECTNIKCNGAWSTDAISYAAGATLIPKNLYPGSSVPGTCKLYSQLWLLTKGVSNMVSMYEVVNFQGWMGLLLALQQQPVIVNLQGSYPSFQNYVGGIYTDRSCTDSVIDHSVVFVGYNLQGGTPYWILRNSWGTDWGEDGYMRIMMTGGRGICGIHAMPGVYPVVPSILSVNPCLGINPCGSGKCNWSLFSKQTCTCPSQFISVTNTDGSQTCAPIKMCSYLPTNPCGSGTCVDDMLGSYYCICPPGSSSGVRVDGSTTCIPAILSQAKSTSYKIQQNDTCCLIATGFSIAISNLTQSNPGLNCNSLVPGTTITIPISSGCSVSYSINSNDTCQSIRTLFNLTPTNFTTLNPALNCSNLIPAQQICVAPGPFAGFPICTQYQVAYPGDTYQSIMLGANLTPLEFFGLNPGLNCDKLTIDNSTLTPGTEVCISGKPPRSCSCSTKNYYYVQPSDTCSRIISNYYTGYGQFKSLNCNMACSSSQMYVGQQLCRP